MTLVRGRGAVCGTPHLGRIIPPPDGRRTCEFPQSSAASGTRRIGGLRRGLSTQAWLATACVSACSTLLATPAAGADNTPPPRTQSYDIPAQPLSSAVEAFAIVSGVQVLYDRPAGSQPRSHAVHGVFTPSAALQTLLENTGLSARFTDSRDAVLAPATGAAAPPEGAHDALPRLALSPLRVQGALVLDVPVRDGDAFARYARGVRDQLQQALSADPSTARGDYDAALEVWIGPGGEVRQVGIARTSGAAQQDADILAVVRRLVMEDAPPADMIQPIRVAVHSRRRRN